MVWTGLRCLRTLDFSDKYLPSSLTEEGSAFHFRSIGWMYKGGEADQAIVRMREDYYSFLYRVFGFVTELEELKLYVPGFGIGLIHCVDQWLDRAVACGVKYLELKIALSISNRYILPGCVLGSKSIVKLVLKNCWLLNLSSFMGTQLPSLREIWFDDVSIDEKGIGIILGICINLESLYLRNCFEFTRLEISNVTPKLQKVDVVVDEIRMIIIEIKLPSLLDFSYWYDSCYGAQTCDLDVSGCKNLKRLSLNNVHFYYHPEFSSYLESFPALEHLCLTKCQSVKYVEISSKCLVYLSINNCRDLVKVELHTPNMKSFFYRGEHVISLVSKGPALKLENANIELRAGFHNRKWYLGLIRLIEKLSHSKNFLLGLATIQDDVIPEDVRLKVRPPLHGVKHLMAEIRGSTRHDYDFVSVNVELVDSLLWLAPFLDSLHVSNFDDKIVKLFKFTYKKPLKGCFSVYVREASKRQEKMWLLEVSGY